MDRENQTIISEFLLLGLSSQPERQRLLFWLFLCVYLITVIGNLLIILAIGLDARLHSPMYFFLANLSFVDLCFSQVTIPKMLVNHIMRSNSISYVECMMQIYFFIALGNMDGFLLAVMAYDRYMAICRPLHYTTVMDPGICILLVAISWVITNLHGLLHTLLMAQLSFCADNTINHFYCDPYPVRKLSCSDTFISDLIVFTEGGVVFITPFTGIAISYVFIFSNVIKNPSTQGIQKALSTCGSHLTVVSLFYGAIMGVYLRPSSSYTAVDTVASVIFTVVTPMLNPFIYSLRNQDMKLALRRLILTKAILQMP
ncbi:olfactory receptor 1361-like [Trichosurus vulpecula]|uniref:olfactory receptor 1361-like n=1 Tax=Trichosurus vulpecula TaxID=9337 RepID=UPI00186B4EBC|nr:olfactory receptor 1361-like [Trichosurus vulpecula]